MSHYGNSSLGITRFQSSSESNGMIHNPAMQPNMDHRRLTDKADTGTIGDGRKSMQGEKTCFFPRGSPLPKQWKAILFCIGHPPFCCGEAHDACETPQNNIDAWHPDSGPQRQRWTTPKAHNCPISGDDRLCNSPTTPQRLR